MLNINSWVILGSIVAYIASFLINYGVQASLHIPRLILTDPEVND
jgi:hypothetical protein